MALLTTDANPNFPTWLVRPVRAAVGLVLAVICACTVGCGTTKWTETRRTATEQLLISDSMDQAVGRLDFRALSGKKVYLDDTYLKDVVDANYLISSLRQQLLAHGAILRDKKEEADYVVEVRSGAVGTDMHSVLVGVPQVNLPSVVTAVGLPTALPEIPLIKKTQQSAVTKILLFAYNRKTGRPLWQSGAVLAKSDASDVWIFGAGPFQKGTIYQGTQFAGERLPIKLPDVPLIDLSAQREPVSLLEEAFYAEPLGELSQDGAANSQDQKGASTPNRESPGTQTGEARTTPSGSPLRDPQTLTPPALVVPSQGPNPQVASPMTPQLWPAFPPQ
ncbi:MAG: hypothetical protein H5U08_14305 [Thermogutta sp.]|uniref:DUF6655 family protein n=1 Tax=Thermogutta sp. TaxID=1962930 RepID=UPI0019B684C0|nr:DUF6655 family protein [Thermogutta sp.]MBC7353530.1 hypothetical protein [Thermogutta sp.]